MKWIVSTLLFALSLPSCVLFDKPTNVKGTVTNSITGNKVGNLPIEFKCQVETQIGTEIRSLKIVYSDANGEFETSIPPADGKLYAQVGFDPSYTSDHVFLNKGQSDALNVHAIPFITLGVHIQTSKGSKDVLKVEIDLEPIDPDIPEGFVYLDMVKSNQNIDTICYYKTIPGNHISTKSLCNKGIDQFKNEMITDCTDDITYFPVNYSDTVRVEIH